MPWSRCPRPPASRAWRRRPDVLAEVTAAKLFIAGHEDTAAAEAVNTLYAETLQPKRPVILTTGDHGTDILTGNQAGIASTEIIRWLERYSAGGRMSRPIVFLTDYGRSDAFVGICHGVMARIAPDARVIDLTHAVPRQDVLRGAVELARAVPYMPADAVYVAVVDPGVGSDRRAVAVAAGASLLVGPDNGVLSLAWDALGGVTEAVEIASPAVVLAPVSRTFHGRDIFAPAAAHLAAGRHAR